ncbi:MAG: hypothetical protein AAFR73_11090 [Pseudomonadota bacterium]
MGLILLILALLLPVFWFAGVFGIFFMSARALRLKNKHIPAAAATLLFVFVTPFAINVLTHFRESALLSASATELEVPYESTTLGLVSRMTDVTCTKECQSLLFTGQANRVIVAGLAEEIDPDWSTPQASFVLGDCSDPADLPSGSNVSPINIAKATGLCIHRDANLALSEAAHTILYGEFTRRYTIGPSIHITTARYFVRDTTEQKLVHIQTQIRTHKLKTPLMLSHDWEIHIGNASGKGGIGFWRSEKSYSDEGVHPNKKDMFRNASLDPKRPLLIESRPLPDVLIEALAQSERPKAQDDALFRIARGMVWTPGLTLADRTFVEEFIDSHPRALEISFDERLRFNEYTDLRLRLSGRLPSALYQAVSSEDGPRVKSLLNLLARQPAIYRQAIFEDLMALIVSTANRRSIRQLPSLLADIDGAGPVFIALLEQETGWPAADRASLAHAACQSRLDETVSRRYEAVLRADLASKNKGIADADLAVSISGLARAGVEPEDIAVLVDRHLGPLDTVPLMPTNLRPITAPKTTSLERLNLAWIWQFANGDCHSRAL